MRGRGSSAPFTLLPRSPIDSRASIRALPPPSMGQQHSAFVVEIAPRARFKPLEQAENGQEDDDDDEPEQRRQWRITVNPTDGFGSSELLADVRRCVQRLQAVRNRLVTIGECRLLATAISLTDCNELRLRALDIISQASADPVNQQVMLGIVQRLVDQLRAERRGAARILLLQSVANLAVSNSPAISGSVSVIIPLLDSRNDIERSVAVHAFTNLSMNIPPGQVTVFASAVPVCLKRLWKRGEVDGDMLRLLVNLACCPNLVPYMLANKSVTGLFAIMDCENNEILLRFITWLLCMTSAVEALSIGYERIAQLNHDPFGNPCYSLFHCLYGASGKAELLSKTQLLLGHDNMEIANKSRRLFELLQALNLGGKAGGSTLDQL